MLALLFAYSYAMILFGLTAEADTPWLKVVGFLAALWMVAAGSIAGYEAVRE